MVPRKLWLSLERSGPCLPTALEFLSSRFFGRSFSARRRRALEFASLLPEQSCEIVYATNILGLHSDVPFDRLLIERLDSEGFEARRVSSDGDALDFLISEATGLSPRR